MRNVELGIIFSLLIAVYHNRRAAATFHHALLFFGIEIIILVPELMLGIMTET